MNIYFVGIKGSGMSALALILNDRGNNVKGSDVEKKFFTDHKLNEAKIECESFECEIPNDTDVVIVGNAFDENHKQVILAKSKNIKTIRYYEYLNQFMQSLNNSIAIAGTNGKTTTTAMMTSMLSDFKPNYLIGDGSGVGNINSDYFIFEACEYKNTFLNYYPKYAIINNVEMDHPDFFKDISDVLNTFQHFMNNCENVILNLDDIHSQKLEAVNNNIYYFSLTNPQANLYTQNLRTSASGFNFELIFNNQNLGNYSLPFYGKHMIQNSLACLLVGCLLDENINELINNLQNFTGAKRRFEKYEISTKKNITLIDDYAHHPTSIELLIDGIRQKYPDCELTILFQPHTYSRTNQFLTEFAKVLCKADKLFLLPIFGSIREAAGETSIDDLKAEVLKVKAEVLISELNEIDVEKNKQIICTLGAGDIDTKYIPIIQEMFEEK